MPAAAPLSVWDAGSLIIGIVIGASIFRVPALVFSNSGGALGGVLLWLIGGLLSLAGALCYCELATAYPRLGGDYVYLTRAYGPATGFLFGWMRFTVILPANVGAMAFIFAEHACRLTGAPTDWTAGLAAAAVLMLTLANLVGVSLGKRVQNALTVSKLTGLALILVAGGTAFAAGGAAPTTPPTVPLPSNAGLALVFILYAYGGWSDAAFVAAEVRDVRRNIPRALLAGLGTITALYVLVNLAYLAGLGFAGVCASATPAADLLQRQWGRLGESAISLIVMLSTLGAVNGMLFSGSRLTASLAADHPILRTLGTWDATRGTPRRALVAIGAASLLLVWLVGSDSGRRALATLLRAAGADAAQWSQPAGGFDALVTGAAPTFWMFFCLTAGAVPLLRLREPHVERPFRAGVALTPLVFGATSLYMLWSSLTYARGLSLLGLAVLGVGGLAYTLGASRNRPH